MNSQQSQQEQNRCFPKATELGRQIFPTKPEDFIGKIVCDPELSRAALILREFDDQKDTWEGQVLSNPRRNKYWARWFGYPTTAAFLVCLEWYYPEGLNRLSFYEPAESE